MPRSRIVHPSFFTDENLYEAEVRAGLPLRLAFEGLWCVADREGRFEWKPREIKLDVLPYDPVDMANVLDALADEGFIFAYEVEGKVYGLVRNFKKYQRIHTREAKSAIPEPPPRSSRCTPRHRRGDAKAKPRQRQGDAKATPRCPASTSTSTSTSASTSTSEGAPDGAAPAEGQQAPPGGWPGQVHEIFKAIGLFPPGMIGALLKPAVEEYGEEWIIKAVECYVRRRGDGDKPQFLGPQSFVKRAGYWVGEVKPAKIYADPENGGDPTPEMARELGRTGS